MDDVITLVKESYEKDDIGQQIPVEEKRDILCEVKSISRTEWKAAGQNNINADMMVTTATINYAGEKIAIYHDGRKVIYRTFCPENSDEIELYLKDEAGELGG